MHSNPDQEVSSPETEKVPNFLGKFASLIGLFSAALYFSGWIYRWSYFSFFKLEITNLDLPPQSFLILPIQIFFGNFWMTIISLILFLLTTILILITLWIFHKIERFVRSEVTIPESNRFEKIYTKAITFIKVILRVLVPFGDEAIIITWILIILFWISRYQGHQDARRDASQSTSTLPVISLITPLDKLPLARKFNDVFEDPPLENFGFIGDKGLFDDLRTKEDTDLSNPEQPRVWRLLLHNKNWIYIYVALQPDTPTDMRPSVVAIKEGGGQAMILSSSPSLLLP